MYNIKKHFNSISRFHKDRAKLPFEVKVAQVIEMQKIDIEISKQKKEKRPAYKQVWDLIGVQYQSAPKGTC